MKKTQKKFSPKVLIPLSLALTFSTGMPNAYAETGDSIEEPAILDSITKDLAGKHYISTSPGAYNITDNIGNGSLTINTGNLTAFIPNGSISTGKLIIKTIGVYANTLETSQGHSIDINVNDLELNTGSHGIFSNIDPDSTSNDPASINIKFKNTISITALNPDKAFASAIFINKQPVDVALTSDINSDSTINLNANFMAIYDNSTNNASINLSANKIILNGKNGAIYSTSSNNFDLTLSANDISITSGIYAPILIQSDNSTINLDANNIKLISNANTHSIELSNASSTLNINKNNSSKDTPKSIFISNTTYLSSESKLNVYVNNSNVIFNNNILLENALFNILSDNTGDVTINGILSSDNSTVDINAGNSFSINANDESGTIQTNTDTVNIAANNISLKNTAENASGVALSSSDGAQQRTENQPTLNLTGNNIHIEGTQNAVSLDNAILNINQSSDNSTTYNTTNGKIDFIGVTELNNNSITKISANNQDITFDGAVTINDSEFTLNSTGGITEFTEGLTSNNANINLHFDGENTKLIGAINKGENINTDAPVGLDTNSNTTDLTLANGATWENTGASSLDSLTANDSTIIHNTEDDISIDNYSGSATINVSGSNDNGSFEVTSGKFIIGNAQENSSITLSMDNKDIIDTTNMDSAHEALNTIANKLVFTNSNDQNNNLTGKVIITEGLLTPSTSANISFVTDDNQNNDGFVHVDDVIIPPTDEQPDEELPNPDDTQPAPPSNDEDNENPAPPEIGDIEIGNKITATMRAMRDVATVSILSWQHEDNTLREQLYALQNNDDIFGVWTRFNRGEFEYANEFKNQYNLVQVGYDKFIKDSHYGIAFSHNDSTTSYGYGSGKNQSNSLSFYRTWHNDNNEYTHTILKVGHLGNDYNIYTAAGHTNGDYTTWATTLSHEYGKKINLSDKYFITPQVQLDYSRVFGADYTTNNGIYVEQDDLNSLVGRIGFNLGTSFNNQDNFFLKASISHQFAGTADTILHHGNITNNFTQDLGNTWYEIGLGSNVQVGEHTYLMADITKTFGDDLSTPWQYNLGLRWSFN